MIEVLRAGLLSSVQDQGRCGHAAIGVGRAGAMDADAAQLANWLAGNDAAAAVIEITLSGPALRFARATTIALCGAEAELRLDGARIAGWRPQAVAAGSVLDCGGLRRGARVYLAVAGGIAVAPVLGSRSVDINAALGPCAGRALRAGDQLPLAAEDGLRLRRTPAWSLAPATWFDPDPQRRLRLLPGAHYAELQADAQQALQSEVFRVAPESNRVGLRLQGATLQLRRPLELVSAGVTRGTVQLPPGGQPIMLAAEHPTTGGYPRIAHLIEADQSRLGQYRPGDSLCLRLVGTDEAEALRVRRTQALARVHHYIEQRLLEIRCGA